MKIRLTELREKAKTRPDGYLEDCLSRGIVKNDVLILDHKAYIELLKIYDPSALTKINQGCPTCGNKPKPVLQTPPMIVQAKNAFSATSRVISNMLNNRPIKATDEVIAQRRETCNACEKYDSARGKCALCGCFVKWKVTLASEKCPDNPPRW